MTNKEKALEISKGYCDENPLIFKGEFNRHDSAFKEGYAIGQHKGALKMAEWKDQQFKEYLEKKLDVIEEIAFQEKEHYGHSSISAEEKICVVKEIIKELFKEEQK